MTVEQIEKFLDSEKEIPKNKAIKIDFKRRNSIRGLIVQGKDYGELKTKNFWRVVSDANLSEYHKSKNIGLAKIFSGSEFTRLSVVANKEA